MSKLPDDLIEITSYNGRHGNIDLKGLMYSPSEKALYNKGFLNKKINLNNKKNFYSYVKSENPLERKRICINLSRFLTQYPQYKNISEIETQKNNFNDEKNGNRSKSNESNGSVEISIEYDENSNGNDGNENKDIENENGSKASPTNVGIDENQFLDILNNYKD